MTTEISPRSGMANNVSANRLEVAELGRWCSLVVRYLSTLGNEILLGEVEKAVANAIKSGNLRGLKTLKRDFLEWARGLTPAQQRGLDAALNAAGLPTLASENKSEEATVLRIIARGKIKNDDEYRLLSSWMDVLLDDGSKRDEAAKLDAMLTSYGTRSRRGQRRDQ